jgi:lipopolysaccharide biosynthesis regulator YciM
MPRHDRERQDEFEREPEWSRNQAFIVEQMQPTRSSEQATSHDTIMALRAENDKLRDRVAVLQKLATHIDTRVMPALARIYDGAKCPAKHHSPYWRCPDCDLRVFLETWRKDDANAR